LRERNFNRGDRFDEFNKRLKRKIKWRERGR